MDVFANILKSKGFCVIGDEFVNLKRFRNESELRAENFTLKTLFRHVDNGGFLLAGFCRCDVPAQGNCKIRD